MLEDWPYGGSHNPPPADTVALRQVVWGPGQSPVGKLRPDLALRQDARLRIVTRPCEPTFLVSSIPLPCCKIENPYAGQMPSEGTGTGGALGQERHRERSGGTKLPPSGITGQQLLPGFWLQPYPLLKPRGKRPSVHRLRGGKTKAGCGAPGGSENATSETTCHSGFKGPSSVFRSTRPSKRAMQR